MAWPWQESRCHEAGRRDGGQDSPAAAVPWMTGRFYLDTWQTWRIQKSIQLKSPCGHIRQPARLNPHSEDFQDSLRNTHRSRRIPTANLPLPTAPYHHTPTHGKPTTRDPLPQLQLNITPTPQSPSPQTPTWVGKQLSVTGPYTTHTTSVTHTPPSPWAPIYNPTAYRLSYMSYKLRAWD